MLQGHRATFRAAVWDLVCRLSFVRVGSELDVQQQGPKPQVLHLRSQRHRHLTRVSVYNNTGKMKLSNINTNHHPESFLTGSTLVFAPNHRTEA